MRKQPKLTQDEVVALIKKRQGERSLRQFAEDLGISAAYLSDIYLGKREPGEKILVQFGIVKNVQTSTEYVQQ